MVNKDVNGCGGKGSLIKPPFHKFFEASCNKHDEGYEIGGDELRRFECDAKFLTMMIKDAMREDYLFSRLFFQSWALIYYFAVRINGSKYFNYKNKQIRMQNTLKIAEEAGGLGILLSAIGINIWKAITGMPINGWFVLLTSIGGFIYLIYKILTQRKESILKDLEIEREKLEIERLKKKV